MYQTLHHPLIESPKSAHTLFQRTIHTNRVLLAFIDER